MLSASTERLETHTHGVFSGEKMCNLKHKNVPKHSVPFWRSEESLGGGAAGSTGNWSSIPGDGVSCTHRRIIAYSSF